LKAAYDFFFNIYSLMMIDEHWVHWIYTSTVEIHWVLSLSVVSSNNWSVVVYELPRYQLPSAAYQLNQLWACLIWHIILQSQINYSDFVAKEINNRVTQINRLASYGKNKTPTDFAFLVDTFLIYLFLGIYAWTQYKLIKPNCGDDNCSTYKHILVMSKSLMYEFLTHLTPVRSNIFVVNISFIFVCLKK
jgi:hypothetical protein